MITGSHVHLRSSEKPFQHIEIVADRAQIYCHRRDEPMTRLSISMAAVLLTMSLAPAAQAYGTDPADDTLSRLSQISFAAADTADAAGTCTIKVTPSLDAVLALPDDWRTGDTAKLTTVACNGDN